MKYILVALCLVLGTACERVTPTTERHRDPDPVDLWTVNKQSYFFEDLGPVNIAYDAVARHLDWDIKYAENGQLMIDAWRNFVVNDLILKESGGCPYVRGGARYNATGDSCDSPVRVGRRSDTGFGQVTPVFYRGPNTVICKHTGMCSWQDILKSPWTSMLATLIVVQEVGSGPWCYKEAKGYHNCSLAPDR